MRASSVTLSGTRVHHAAQRYNLSLCRLAVYRCLVWSNPRVRFRELAYGMLAAHSLSECFTTMLRQLSIVH